MGDIDHITVVRDCGATLLATCLQDLDQTSPVGDFFLRWGKHFVL